MKEADDKSSDLEKTMGVGRLSLYDRSEMNRDGVHGVHGVHGEDAGVTGISCAF